MQTFTSARSLEYMVAKCDGNQVHILDQITDKYLWSYFVQTFTNARSLKYMLGKNGEIDKGEKSESIQGFIFGANDNQVHIF